ncbi:MAG: hypothetical protein R3293_21390 [Candidatus Promineifilaceae bacterium]|nr:hypothetical protein [Candidatus Promineifilaceae bacterium]
MSNPDHFNSYAAAQPLATLSIFNGVHGKLLAALDRGRRLPDHWETFRSAGNAMPSFHT